jgi:crotonobetainyl-CoA:carnitine CoA-transferase CaiB-like acyl-CoA transferase
MEKMRVELGVEEVTQEIFDGVIAGKTRDELVDYMAWLGIPVAPVFDLPEIEGDPHIKAREMIIEVDHPKAGKIKTVNFPVKFSETPVEEMRPAPLFGQHNKEVLVDLLGYSEERFRELEIAGVVLGE